MTTQPVNHAARGAKRTDARVLPVRLGVAMLLLALPPAMLYTLWTNPLSAGEDDCVYYYPLRKMVAQQVLAGQWPLSNPYEATGVPLMADPQSALLHPTTWLFLALDAKLAYTLSLMVAFWLAGGGAYLYLRRLGLLREAAVLGAVVLMFCGFMVGHRVHQSVVLAAAMLPWGLWCIEGMRRQQPTGKPKRGAVLAAAAWMVPAAFLTIAAGHWPTLIHITIIWTAYGLLRARPLLPAAAGFAGAMLLAAAAALPQLVLTWNLMQAVTRQDISYAMAGENSFMPPSAVLAVFPHIMGSRTPNFFPQAWWGPWHLCEMLGYVGLLTLPLAATAIWRLYRRPKPPPPFRHDADADVQPPLTRAQPPDEHLRAIVRPWTWLIIGAGLFMLGYYLPPLFKLVHALPVLKVVRAPARMVLAVDMGLATLAAVAVHAVLTRPRGSRGVRRVGRGVLRGVSLWLPAAMAAALGIFALGAWAIIAWFPQFAQRIPSFEGGATDVLDAVNPANPAVWQPLAVLALTILAVRWWLGRPRKRVAVLVAVLLVDLFFVTRFVDVPPAGAVGPDPQDSPAADWLWVAAPDTSAYRVWGLGLPNADGQLSYNARASELLLPKVSGIHGFASIGNYGPFQSAQHVHAFGFRIWGANRDWPGLIRRNHLLSLYGVRYILTADRAQQDVIESVKVAAADDDQPPATQPAELLGGEWQLQRADLQEGVLSLATPSAMELAKASQPVSLQPDTWYRIRFDARAPRSAGSYVRAEAVTAGAAPAAWDAPTGAAINVEAEQIGRQWRRFEWCFRTPADGGGDGWFVVSTQSEWPIEVRNLSLALGEPDRPINFGNRLLPGQNVYEKVATIPPRRNGDEPVVIYENRLWLPVPPGAAPASEDDVESLKWLGPSTTAVPASVPNIALAPPQGIGPRRLLLAGTLPAAAIWVGLVTFCLLGRRRIG
jgi:hypothetical protein